MSDIEKKNIITSSNINIEKEKPKMFLLFFYYIKKFNILANIKVKKVKKREEIELMKEWMN